MPEGKTLSHSMALITELLPLLVLCVQNKTKQKGGGISDISQKLYKLIKAMIISKQLKGEKLTNRFISHEPQVHVCNIVRYSNIFLLYIYIFFFC